jgi:hypothetical protein
MAVLRRSEVRGVLADIVLLKERDSFAPFTFSVARGSVVAADETDKLDLDNWRDKSETKAFWSQDRSL